VPSCGFLGGVTCRGVVQPAHMSALASAGAHGRSRAGTTDRRSARVSTLVRIPVIGCLASRPRAPCGGPRRPCGVFSTSLRQHRTTAPKDLPYGEAPLAVRWRKAQYRRRESRCPRKAFTESIAELPPSARVTGRLRRHAGAAVGAGASVAGVAAGLPMSWPTVHDAFVDHAETLLAEPAPPTVLKTDLPERQDLYYATAPSASTAAASP